jgi:hypothetical protein
MSALTRLQPHSAIAPCHIRIVVINRANGLWVVHNRVTLLLAKLRRRRLLNRSVIVLQLGFHVHICFVGFSVTLSVVILRISVLLSPPCVLKVEELALLELTRLFNELLPSVHPLKIAGLMLLSGEHLHAVFAHSVDPGTLEPGIGA